MSNQKYELMSDEETARIIGITLQRLYGICDIFDARNDDQWDLKEGEHFEWHNKGIKKRCFYEEGAMALAKYLQETETNGFVASIIDAVLEKLTNRRKRTRQLLVRRRVILEVQNLEGTVVQGDLVFLTRSKAIRILDTNGKGLNAAARREQANCGLVGRSPMEKGIHFTQIEDTQYWSQRGLVRIAQNMSENLSQKSRKAWVEAVAEVYEDAIEQQRKYLESFDAKVKKAMVQVKEMAKKKCQVTLEKQRPYDAFDLHVHHLFDRSTRPDLATLHDNLLVMRENLHQDFHKWHGSGSCEPRHFIDYLTTVESWRFDSPKMTTHLHQLINRLENLQKTFEGHYEVWQQFK